MYIPFTPEKLSELEEIFRDHEGLLQRSCGVLDRELRDSFPGMAQELVRLWQIERENTLPTKQEEKEFYERAYHVCDTGCLLPCLKKRWNCRFHPTDWWHEVGCPHIKDLEAGLAHTS